MLNLGLNDESINGLIAQTENPRFAWDSYRRFIQMFSNVVMGLDGDLFENAITSMKNVRGAASDTDLSADDLKELVAEFKQIFSENVSAEEYPSLVVDGSVQFPQDPSAQLQLAIEAVFGSWNNPRAVLYRKQNKIADDPVSYTHLDVYKRQGLPLHRARGAPVGHGGQPHELQRLALLRRRRALVRDRARRGRHLAAGGRRPHRVGARRRAEHCGRGGHRCV